MLAALGIKCSCTKQLRHIDNYSENYINWFTDSDTDGLFSYIFLFL